LKLVPDWLLLVLRRPNKQNDQAVIAINQNVQHMDIFKETELLVLILELNVEFNGGTKKKHCDDVKF